MTDEHREQVDEKVQEAEGDLAGLERRSEKLGDEIVKLASGPERMTVAEDSGSVHKESAP